MNFLVINLKKYFFTFLFSIFIVCLIIFSDTNLVSAQNGLVLWATKLLPSLFPFFIAAELLTKTNFAHILGKLLNNIIKPLFNVPGESLIAIILGFICGYPVGAKIVCNLKKDKIISKIEAERLIAYTNNSGPLFILGTIGISLLSDKRLGYVLLVSHILSAFLVGYFFRFWKKDRYDISFNENKFNYSYSPIRISTFGEVLSAAIRNSISSLLLICGFVVLFSVILDILKYSGILSIFTNFFELFNIPSEFSSGFLFGILELTNGVNLVSSLYTSYPLISVLLISFLLGFGGFSVLLQVYSIISKENISIKPYFLGKLLQGIFSILFTFIFI